MVIKLQKYLLKTKLQSRLVKFFFKHPTFVGMLRERIYQFFSTIIIITEKKFFGAGVAFHQPDLAARLS